MIIPYNMLQYTGKRNTTIIMDDADGNDADQVLIRIHFIIIYVNYRHDLRSFLERAAGYVCLCFY